MFCGPEVGYQAVPSSDLWGSIIKSTYSYFTGTIAAHPETKSVTLSSRFSYTGCNGAMKIKNRPYHAKLLSTIYSQSC